MDNQNPNIPVGPAPNKNKAVASLVCGIAALVIAWFGWGAIVAIALAIVGIILGIAARKEMPPGTAGMATAGLVCSIIALILSTIVFISCVICFAGLASMTFY